MSGPGLARASPGRCQFEVNGHRQPPRGAAVQLHANLGNLPPEKIERFHDRSNIPPFVMATEIAGEPTIEILPPGLISPGVASREAVT